MNFGTLLNWLGRKKKKATQYEHANLGKQTELQLAGRRRGKVGEGGGGKGGGRVSSVQFLPPPPQHPAPGTVAACGGMEWMRKMWLFGEAGVPETKCLVNTDVS